MGIYEAAHVWRAHRLFKMALAHIKKLFYSNLLRRRLSDMVENIE